MTAVAQISTTPRLDKNVISRNRLTRSSALHSCSSECTANGSKFNRRLPENSVGVCKGKGTGDAATPSVSERGNGEKGTTRIEETPQRR